MNINFDTGYMSKEEATGLRALLDAINGTLPTAAELREKKDQMYASAAYIGSPSKTVLGPAASAPYSGEAVEAIKAQAEAVSDEPKRERGKPAPGKQRRTKEEIAEDEATEKSEAQAISTGGERVGPEDDEETAAQDKADEQAEVEAARKPEAPLTADDVRNAVGLYVNKFGMEAATADGPGLFVSVLGDPPAGNPFWKMSILPDDQKKLKACVDAWRTAAASDTRYGA
jgi:hypothetical protein